MSDAIFVAKKVSSRLKISDKREIDKAAWRKPRGIKLTPSSRYIVGELHPLVKPRLNEQGAPCAKSRHFARDLRSLHM
jgi:hypothetical protein